MIDFLVVMILASASIAVSKALRLPYIPLLVISGSAVSFVGLDLDHDFIQNGMIFGITFLLFAAGTSMNPSRVGDQKATALKIGAAQLVLILVTGFVAGWFLGLSYVESLYLGSALAASSTLVVIRLLQNRGQLFEPFGRLVVGVLLLQDVFIILLTAVVSHVDGGMGAMATSLGAILALTAAAVALSHWVVPRLFLGRGADEERQLFFALGVLFVFLGASQILDVHFVGAAFLAGVSLSSFPTNGIIRGQLSSLASFFTAIFFVTLGIFIEVPGFSAALVAIGLAALVIVVTPVLVGWLGYRSGMTLRSAIEAGLLLALTSEFSIIMAISGAELGHISPETLGMITLFTVVTMTVTPFVANDASALWLADKVARWGRQQKHFHLERENHLVFLGCGESGLRLLQEVHDNDPSRPILAVDRDVAVIHSLRERGVEGIVGDAADPRLLRQIGIDRASVVVSTLPRFKDHRVILRAAPNVPVIVRVFDQEEADQLRMARGIPLPVSRPAAEELLAWAQRSSL